MGVRSVIVFGAVMASAVAATGHAREHSELYKRIQARAAELGSLATRATSTTLGSASTATSGSVQFARFTYQSDGEVTPAVSLLELGTGTVVSSEQDCLDTCAAAATCAVAQVSVQEDSQLYCFTYAVSSSGDQTALASQRFMALSWRYDLMDTTDDTCASTLDSFESDGACDCAAGRENTATVNSCESTGMVAKQYSIYQLSSQVTVGAPISWAEPTENLKSIVTATECAALCAGDDTCKLFYYELGATMAACWKIGAGDSYPLDSASNAPGMLGASLTKRAYSGAIGADGGQLGIITAAVGCDSMLGDMVEQDFTCQCGPGRTNTDAFTCAALAPSQGAAAAARRLRKRLPYGGVQW